MTPVETADNASISGSETAPAPPAPIAPAPEAAPAAEVDPEVPEYVDALEAARRAAPASAIDGKDWTKGALIIVGAGIPKTTEKRPVIVCEARDDDGQLIPSTKYFDKADLYFRTGADIDMDGLTPVVTLGQDVEQLALWGMSPDVRFVCVGPAHPAYGAINLAYARGALDVEVVGLTDFWKQFLAPWLARVPTDSRLPAPELNIKIS